MLGTLALDRLRDGLSTRKGFTPAHMKFFGRYRAGFIRDGVLPAIS